MVIKMKKVYDENIINEHIKREDDHGIVDVNLLRPGQLLNILDNKSIAYIPLGTVEWHGRHNPLGVDSIKAIELCTACAKITGGFVMPHIYGAADAHWNAGHGVGVGMDATAGFLLPGNFYHVPTHILVDYISAIVKNLLERG